MGKVGEEGDAYRACTSCTRACQSAHGKGKAIAVPRFHKTVSDYAVHSKKNSWLQIPRGYIREHIGKDVREEFILEGAMGSEWVVSFNAVGFYAGWKSFAADHGLEKGDQLMVGLVGTNRFVVNVFDKYGMEKVSSKGSDPWKERGSKRKAVGDEETQLISLKKRNVEVSTPANGLKERSNGFLEGLNLECAKRPREEQSDDSDSPTESSSQSDPRLIKCNGYGGKISTKASGKKVHHERAETSLRASKRGETSGLRFAKELQLAAGEKNNSQIGPCEVNRTSEFPFIGPRTKSKRKHHSVQPEAPSSSSSDPSSDSVRVLLAKAVLAKAKHKKLKKLRKSFLPPVLRVMETIKDKDKGRSENSSSSSEEEDGANPSRNGNRMSKGSKRQADLMYSERSSGKSLDKEEESASEGQANTYGDASVEPYNPVGAESRERVEGSNCTESGVRSSETQQETNRTGAVNMNEMDTDAGPGRKEARISNGLAQEVYREHHTGNGSPDVGQNDTCGTENGENVLGKGGRSKTTAEHQRGVLHDVQPNPTFQAALVKEEPGIPNEGQTTPHMDTAHHQKCVNCGLAAMADVGRFPSPRANVKSEEGVQLATEGPPACPKVRTPRSANGQSLDKTEIQKQKALDAANAFSAQTKYPSIVVVMRASCVKKRCACTLSVRNAELFPKVRRSLILVDSEGYMRKADWTPERHYMQGSGWRDFVRSHSLEVDDVCVMEVIENSGQHFKVLIHIFRRTGKEQAIAAPVRTIAAPVTSSGARTRSEGKKAQVGQSPCPLPPEHHSKRKRAHNDEEEDAGKADEEELQQSPRKERVKRISAGKARRSGVLSATNGGKKHGQSEAPVSLSERGELATEAKAGSRKLLKSAKKKKEREMKHILSPGGGSPLLTSSSPAEERATTPRGERSASKQKKGVKRLKDVGELPRNPKGEKMKSRNLHKVLRLLDRRNGVHGVVFLVELDGEVVQGSKKGRVNKDANGHWWVPYDHFTPDFFSCYVD